MDATVLGSINWEVLVVDEAHRLKNNQSKVRKHSHTRNPKQIKYSTCTLIEELLSPSHSLQWLIFTPCISGYVFEVLQNLSLSLD